MIRFTLLLSGCTFTGSRKAGQSIASQACRWIKSPAGAWYGWLRSCIFNRRMRILEKALKCDFACRGWVMRRQSCHFREALVRRNRPITIEVMRSVTTGALATKIAGWIPTKMKVMNQGPLAREDFTSIKSIFK